MRFRIIFAPSNPSSPPPLSHTLNNQNNQTHPHIHRIVDGEWTDPDIPDPLTNMFDLLTERKDRALTQKWGVWLTRKDTERAINVRFALLCLHSTLPVSPHLPWPTIRPPSPSAASPAQPHNQQTDQNLLTQLLTSLPPPSPSHSTGKRSQVSASASANKAADRTADELAMLQEIRAANPEAGVRFLEHLVLGKRSGVSIFGFVVQNGWLNSCVAHE